jgi:phosphoribosylanthranilate isomerase
MTLVKICGLTRPEDVDVAVEAGADLVGLIFAGWSPRAVAIETAPALLERVPDGVATVGVFVDEAPERVAEVREGLGLDWVQLHGSESPEVVERFAGHAIKAFRLPLQDPSHGEPILLDRAFDSEPTDAELAEHWRQARRLGSSRRVLLAGALSVANVADAVRAARPWAVDGVRGTESTPGIKDHELVRAFVRAAKEADE